MIWYDMIWYDMIWYDMMCYAIIWCNLQNTFAYIGASYVRPVHVLVATPGRLCELITDDSIPMFRDMSGIRFLIVDEADRIVEEGHFPEVKE